MSEDQFDEIMQRLEALEARLEAGSVEGRATDPDDPLPDRPNPDEKRFVDLIVDLVGKRVAQVLRDNTEQLVDPRAIADLTATAVLDRTWNHADHGGGWDRERRDHGPRDHGPRDHGHDRGPRDRGPRHRHD